MGRRKVRRFPSKQFYEQILEQYFKEHHDEVLKHTANALGFPTFEALREFEFSGYYGGFGFDCGWIKLAPIDSKMYHEWELDNGKYCAEIFTRPSYNTQSTTIMREEVKKAVSDLGWEDVFYVRTVLD